MGFDEETERLAKELVDSAIKVHRILGPGLLESAYEACLVHELRSRGIEVRSQVPISIVYENQKIDVAYRADLILGGLILVELKSCEQISPIHKAQVLTYLKLSTLRLAFLINFNVTRLVDGLQRIAL